MGVSKKENFKAEMEIAFQGVLDIIGDHGNIDVKGPNFKETAQRVARAYLEIFDGMFDSDSVGKILSKTFPAKSKEMITVGPISVWSMCPHHFLPCKMQVWVAYLPHEYVLGLSKMVRLAEVIAKRPALQEDTTVEIAERLWMGLKPHGAACLIRGRHLCMEMRGVKKEAVTTTTSLQGDFLRPEVREEFLAAVRAGNGGF